MKKYCKECKKEITRGSKLGFCKSCSHKANRNSAKKLAVRIKLSKKAKGRIRPDLSEINRKRAGKNHPCFKHGKWSKGDYCKKCGKPVCYNTWYYGSGLCGSCSAGGTGIPGENTEYGAEFDNNLKEQVRFRDKYKCQICGCSQLENGKQLDVHHIDYNKRNNKLNNLVALCHICHLKTNHKRKFWTKQLIKKEC